MAVLASWQAVCLMPGGAAAASSALMGICLAQELLALRLALEEGCGPGPGPPRELSFTKSSQAVRAVQVVLASACSSQWEQLRGLGGDEDGLQKPGTEGGRPLQVTHPSPGSPHRAPGPGPAQEWRMETVPRTGWDPKSCQGLEPPPCNHESAPLAAAWGAERACPGTPSGFREDEAQGGHGM